MRRDASVDGAEWMTAVRTAGAPAAGVRSEIRDGVAWLTLDCRATGGRLTAAAAQALCDAAADIRLDDRIAVVVLQSRAGDFCRGFEPGEWMARIDCVAALASLPPPVVAAIGGRALGEGCELALACDLRLASDAAAFGFPQVGEGRMPCHGATQRLPRLVGASRALEMLWSGRLVRAREAERIGLVTRVVAAARLRRAVTEVTVTLRRKGPVALRLAKEAVRAGGDLTLAQGIRLEADLYVLLQTTRDRAEGVRAFRGKRAPRFSGT